jgi:hypothetical protein
MFAAFDILYMPWLKQILVVVALLICICLYMCIYIYTHKLHRKLQQATVATPGFASFISVAVPTPTDKGTAGTDKLGSSSSYAAVPPQEPWSPSHLERAEVPKKKCSTFRTFFELVCSSIKNTCICCCV